MVGRNSGVLESGLNILYQLPRESHLHGALHELLLENIPHMWGRGEVCRSNLRQTWPDYGTGVNDCGGL